jgi:hypothetical protein
MAPYFHSFGTKPNQMQTGNGERLGGSGGSNVIASLETEPKPTGKQR